MMVRIRSVVGCAVGLGALLMATLGSPAAASATPATPLAPVNGDGWAGYYTTNVETQASTTFVVPRISCSGNPSGTFAGQALGVSFLSNYNGTTGPGFGPNSLVETYCIGQTAFYTTEFWFPNAAGDNEVSTPAGVAVQPGDLVLTSVNVTGAKSVDTVVNLSRSWDNFAQKSSYGVTDAAPNLGTIAIAGNSIGPNSIGTGASGSPPPPSSPVLFFANQIGYQPLELTPGLTPEEWVNLADSSQVWVTPSPLFADSFVDTVTP